MSSKTSATTGGKHTGNLPLLRWAYFDRLIVRTGEDVAVKTPWSEGHLVCGSAEGSQVMPLAYPFPYIDPFESSSSAAKL